jgi:hypothetical protein
LLGIAWWLFKVFCTAMWIFNWFFCSVNNVIRFLMDIGLKP